MPDAGIILNFIQYDYGLNASTWSVMAGEPGEHEVSNTVKYDNYTKLLEDRSITVDYASSAVLDFGCSHYPETCELMLTTTLGNLPSNGADRLPSLYCPSHSALTSPCPSPWSGSGPG